jgi:hypothetical protein
MQPKRLFRKIPYKNSSKPYPPSPAKPALKPVMSLLSHLMGNDEPQTREVGSGKNGLSQELCACALLAESGPCGAGHESRYYELTMMDTHPVGNRFLF